MKSTFARRFRRRSAPSKSEGSFFKKESNESFFGGSEHETFFQHSTANASSQSVQRKCDECGKEDKKVHRMEDKKEDKVMRVEEKKEKEKIHRESIETEDDKKLPMAEDKQDQEKLHRQPEKREDDKLHRAADKKEEDKKVMKMEDKKEDDKIHKKETATATGAGKSVSSYVNSLNGKGQPLAANANQFFSTRMGYDFSNVKVHTDKEAAESAKSVNAKAYAIGNNVVFNEGQYNTESAEGKKLMAHELAHVVQQESMLSKKIQKQPAPGPAGQPVSLPSDKISDGDMNTIAAIVAIEAAVGAEEDMEWVYVHLYSVNNLNQSTPFRGKHDTYKFHRFLLDDSFKSDILKTDYYKSECKKLNSKNKACDKIKTIEDVYKASSAYYDGADKARVKQIKAELANKFNNPAQSRGFTSNGNLDDLNKDGDEWRKVRAYLELQDADPKADKLVKVLPGPFEIVYKKEKIMDFFQKNPGKLPKTVPKYPNK